MVDRKAENVQPPVNWSQFPPEGAVEEGLEEVIEPAAALGLLRLHRPHLRHTGGELALESEWRNRHG